MDKQLVWLANSGAKKSTDTTDRSVGTRSFGYPVKFLDDVAWFANRKLSAAARSTIFRKAADGAAPDLAWLRQTTLTDQRLELLASNPQTNWKTFMRVSEKPSDIFPQNIAKRGVENKHYAQAGAKLRGVAGEIVVGEMELPGKLKIVLSQVPVDEAAARAGRGTVIDYKVVDSAGEAWLEVKGWSKRQWKAQLDANEAGKGDEYIQHLFKQLDDAKASGKPTYLAVTDAIKNTPLDDALHDALAAAGFKKTVKVIYFDETKLKSVAAQLRNAMAIAAGATAGAAIVDRAIAGEDDDPQTD